MIMNKMRLYCQLCMILSSIAIVQSYICTLRTPSRIIALSVRRHLIASRQIDRFTHNSLYMNTNNNINNSIDETLKEDGINPDVTDTQVEDIVNPEESPLDDIDTKTGDKPIDDDVSNDDVDSNNIIVDDISNVNMENSTNNITVSNDTIVCDPIAEAIKKKEQELDAKILSLESIHRTKLHNLQRIKEKISESGKTGFFMIQAQVADFQVYIFMHTNKLDSYECKKKIITLKYVCILYLFQLITSEKTR